jgi:hypothetical protein
VQVAATIEGVMGTANVSVIPVPVASVLVTPGSPSLVAGTTLQLSATLRDAQGNVLSGRVVVWGSSAVAIATVNQAGLVTGMTAGPTQISATSEGITGTTLVTVTPVPVATVTVALSLGQVAVAQTSQATATMRDASGSLLVGRSVSWTSNPAGLVTVSATGLVTGITMGSTSVIATSEGRSGQAAITIIAPTSFGAGTRIIGVNIGPGLYRSNNAASASCYWERLSGFGGTLAEIIANDIAGGPAVVAVAATDLGFNSSGCVIWSLVTGPITLSPTAPFGAGTFIVGSDIAPGTWQSDGTGTSCYWARLSGFTGLLAQIITNNFGAAPAVVTFSATDAGFQSSRCGTWSKI